VNDIDLRRNPKSPKILKTPFLAFTVIEGNWIRRKSRVSVRFPISD